MDIQTITKKYAYKIEPKPEGGFIARPSDPTVPPIEGATREEVQRKIRETVLAGLSQAFPDVEPVVTTPRVGMAYNITKSTVIRGGVGLFTDLYQGLIADRFITNTPAVASFTTTSGLVALSNPNSVCPNSGGATRRRSAGMPASGSGRSGRRCRRTS